MKKGDRVKVNSEGYLYNGLIGTILDIKVVDNETYYQCPFPSIIAGFDKSWWTEDDLEQQNSE
jgi:hypothetical protein